MRFIHVSVSRTTRSSTASAPEKGTRAAQDARLSGSDGEIASCRATPLMPGPGRLSRVIVIVVFGS